MWREGSVTSELSLDDKTRFRRVRRRGTFQLARAGESVRAVLQHGCGTCLDLYLPARILTACLENECERVRGGLEVLPVGLESDSVITRLGDEIAAEIESPGLASRLAMDSATLLLAVSLIRRWSNQSDQVRQPTGGLAPWQIRRATAYIHDNLARDIPLAELAGVVKLSPFHFSRAFKQSCGKPPHAFQYGLRVERAQTLLVETELSVTEIAGRVGYEAPQTLARVFQRVLGVSPTAYRRQRRF
jgi:AraC family transcriptional regulator